MTNYTAIKYKIFPAQLDWILSLIECLVAESGLYLNPYFLSRYFVIDFCLLLGSDRPDQKRQRTS